jgi:hypothetical protein
MCSYLDIVEGLVWFYDRKDCASSGPLLAILGTPDENAKFSHRQRLFPLGRLLILSGSQ